MLTWGGGDGPKAEREVGIAGGLPRGAAVRPQMRLWMPVPGSEGRSLVLPAGRAATLGLWGRGQARYARNARGWLAPASNERRRSHVYMYMDAPVYREHGRCCPGKRMRAGRWRVRSTGCRVCVSVSVCARARPHRHLASQVRSHTPYRAGRGTAELRKGRCGRQGTYVHVRRRQAGRQVAE